MATGTAGASAAPCSGDVVSPGEGSDPVVKAASGDGAPAGPVAGCSLNTDTVPSSAPAMMRVVPGEAETHLISSPVTPLQT
ncbi:MAG: hypothetical protein KA818_03475, partial [Methanoculleus sp.]|nr:hypothetical protein [Methanoculleus sp.]